MRILSISGQNIASLSDRFDIDFTAAPLNAAGIFAITGETGAGKSSILDAMCLALYGDVPRLATGASSDEVLDPSGDVMKAKDARAVLRRGAVQGWAEVRFTARDGQDYVARWQARRARDKADGKLQNVSRSLARAADQRVLASQTTVVTEQIVALTGLTYEEFRRTVLLAQGDFDAFLRADTNERAALLEKVTGTGLYRAISTRVFERTEEARQAHNALTLRRGEHQLLTEEEQAALTEEVVVLSAENAEAVTERAKFQSDLERHAHQVQAARQVDIVKDLEMAALNSWSLAATERERLELLDKAEPLRSLLSRVTEAAARIVTATGTFETKRTQQTEAETEVENLRVAAVLAQAAFVAKEAEFKLLGPQWDEAAALDSQISSAVVELQIAQTAAESTGAEAKTAEADLTRLRSALTQVEIDLSNADAEIEGLKIFQPLADRWDQVRTDILRHTESQLEIEKADTQAVEAAAKLEELQTRATALAAAIDRVSEEETTLQSEATQLTAQIVELEIQHPVQASRNLADLATAMNVLHHAGKDHAIAKGEQAAAIIQEQTANAGMVRADAAVKAAEKAILQAEAQAKALVAPAEQADLALSEAARNLRLRLEPGTPCPVCGSAEHPIHADAALADLASSLRTELTAARKAAQDARTVQVAAERQRADYEAQIKQAKVAIASTKLRMDRAQVDWSAARLQALAYPDCPQDLVEIPDTDLSRIDAARLRVLAAQQAEENAQDSLVQMRKDLTGKASRLDALRENLKAKSVSRDTLAKATNDAERMLSLARQAAQNHRITAERYASAVTKVIAPLGESDALNDPDLLIRLESLVQRVEKVRVARQSACDLLTELAPKVSGQVGKTEAALQLSDSARKDAEARQQALIDLRQRRGSLLDGEPTAAHRTRFNDGRKAALSARDNAQNAQAEAMNRVVAAATSYQAAELELTSANDASLAAKLELNQKRANLGLVDEDLEILFAFGRDEVQTLRNHLRSLDDALIAARASLKERQEDLSRLQQYLPETPAEELRVRLEKVDAASALRQQRLGAIHTLLATDAENRQKLAGLEAKISTARAELDVWQAINAAVGSRNGDRFVRFAQSMTLDVLVESANRHLVDLKPRYRLRRAADLALLVEDVDMGGEARATRSLSGGERFLVSLALALALSRMGGRGGLAATLFIDEGFGSLDSASLDLAIDALERLQSQGRQVGVISHVEAMKDRVPVRIMVVKQGGGKSSVRIAGGLAE